MKHIFRVCDNNGTVLRTINGIKSVKYHVQGGERNVLKFGNAFASSLEVEYYTLSQPDLSVGTVIRYVQHFDESLTDFETPDPKDMVINYFWVDSFQKGAKTCKFVAYDVVTKLSVDYSARLLAIKSNFPMTVNDLVNDIKTYLGFSTIQMFMSGDLHDAVLQYFYVDGITAREILGQIAELNGGNLFGLTTLSNGTLAYNILSQSFLAVNVHNITNSAYTSDYIVAPTDQEEYYVSGVLKTPVFYKQGGLEVGENDISPIDKVVIKKADGTELAYYPLSSPETNVLEIRNNIIAQNIISINSPFPHENLTSNLYQAAQSVSTRPIVTAKLFPFRFPFVCYAIIYFVDIDDTIKQFPIMNLEWTDEAVIIESFGSAIVSRDEESYSSTQDQTNTTISTVNRLEEAVSDIEDMFPVPITQGGTGMSGSTSTTTISDIAVAGSGFSVDSANYVQWGKVAMIDIVFKKTTAVTTPSVMTAGTIVSGKRPARTANGGTTDTSGAISNVYMLTGGNINVYGTWAANATKRFLATYILP